MKTASVLYSKLEKHDDWRWDSEFLCDEPYHNKKLIYKPISDILTLSQYGLSNEFKRIILPDLCAVVQGDIKKKITAMYNAKALSNRLLDIAKRGVEMAIEKNEKDASKWIEAETNRLGVKLER